MAVNDVWTFFFEERTDFRIRCSVPRRGHEQSSFVERRTVCERRVILRELQNAMSGPSQQIHLCPDHDVFAARLPILVVDYKHAKLAHVSEPSAPCCQRVSRPSISRTRSSRAMFPLTIFRNTRLARCTLARNFRVEAEYWCSPKLRCTWRRSCARRSTCLRLTLHPCQRKAAMNRGTEPKMHHASATRAERIEWM